MFKPWEHLKVEHNYSGTDWYDFTLDLVNLQLTLREFTGQHTATLSFYNTDMDPAESDGTHVVKQGDKIRIWMNNAAGTSRKTATMRVAKNGVSVAIDLTKPAGRQYLVTLRLVGTGVAGVAGAGAGSGVASASELSNTITGAPFEINGEGDGSGLTAPDGTYTEVSDNDAASELDQIALTRDSNPGLYVYEDPTGTLQIFDMATHQAGAATWVIGPANYSQIVMDFDMSRVVNVLVLKLKKRVRTGHKGTATLIYSTRYKDDASIAKYGRRRKVVTIHGRTDAGMNDYAAAVFAKQADPVPVPTSVTIPIREPAELLGGYEDGTYVTKKVTLTAPDAAVYACRVPKIVHTITAKLWTVQVFLRHQDEIQPPRTDNSAALFGAPDTNVANNPDASIEKSKLAFDLDTGWTDPHAVEFLGPQTIRTTYLPTDGTGLLRWNSQSQKTTDFTADGATITVPDPDGYLTPGDELEFQYLTDKTPATPRPGSSALVGSSSAGGDNATEIDLPDGTEPGDLLVLVMNTGALAGTAPACSDPRIPVQPDTGDAHVFFGYGFATESTDPIAVTISDGENNGDVILAAYRITGTISSQLSSGTTNFNPTLPSGSLDAALLLAVRSGSGGTGGGTLASPQGDWTRDAQAVHSGSTSSVWSSPDPAALSVSPSGQTGWRALVIGLEED